MPITKSAKKSLKSSRAKQKQNDTIRKSLEISLKNAKPTTLSKVISLVDKAAKNHIIHTNKANRLKSRLSKKIGFKQVTKRPGAGNTAVTKPKAAKKKTSSKAKTKK